LSATIGAPYDAPVTHPAARVGDDHQCPLSTPGSPPVPHHGGPVRPPGAATVWIGDHPVARVADMATCNGPPDAITMGSSGCLVNDLPVARMGDATAHRGEITTGERRVLIGEAPGHVTMIRRGHVYLIVNRDLHRITMVGVQEFSGTGATQDYVNRATRSINQTWSGPTTFEGQAYQVDARITGRLRGASDPANPATVPTNVVQTNQPLSWTGDHDPSYAYPYGRQPGHQHSTDNDDGDLVSAHEFGHEMGLPDEYIEGPRHPDGTRNITVTGPPGGLMGHVEPGSRPTSDNFNSLVTGEGLLP
jgi:uncharacterized Zn-binding protein involved in type VI secretion